jgi:hypothetical protein
MQLELKCERDEAREEGSTAEIRRFSMQLNKRRYGVLTSHRIFIVAYSSSPDMGTDTRLDKIENLYESLNFTTAWIQGPILQNV